MAERKAGELLLELEALKKENSELKALLKFPDKSAVADDETLKHEREILMLLNDFSLKVAYLPYDELFPFIASKIKSIFNVRAAVINTYDEATSELVLQYSTLSDEENAKLIKLLGGKLLNRRTYVNQKEYKRITGKIYEQIPSLHELTFGAIPDIIGKTIENLFGVDWFAALGLVHNQKLVGTIILAGNKNQRYPEKDIILAFSGIAANALVRKEAEEKLVETEKRYRSIVNSSPYGMHMYDLQEDDKLVFIGANPAADKILGFNHNSIIGLTIEEAFPPLKDTEVPTRYREVVKNNTVWKTEQINYKDDKVAGAFEVYAFRISEHQMVARFLEITERIQRVQTLKESQENLAITLKSIGDGVISTDKLGRITNMNPVAEDMCGWKFEQARGKLLDEVFNIVDAATKAKLSNPVEKVIKTGKVVELSNHAVLISKDGTERNISDSAAPILDKENNIQGIVLVFSDVTEKYKAREEIKDRAHREAKHRKALTELATNKIIMSGDIVKAKRLLTEIAAEALEVERCGLWLMSEDNSQMQCIDLFEIKKRKHSEGSTIKHEQCPAYFREVTENSPLAITDVINDLRSIELADSYLIPLGIVSMLDSRVASENGGFGGVVCFEHIGKQRQWHPDEELFASTVASYLVQIITVASKKEIDESLKRNEEILSDIFNSISEGIAYTTLTGELLAVNRTLVEMIGVEENEIVGQNVITIARRLLSGNLAKTVALKLLDILKGNKIPNFEVPLKDKVLEVGAVYNSKSKRITGVIRDITSQKIAEKELRESEERYSLVIDASEQGIWDWNTPTNDVYFSPQWKKQIGYDDTELENVFDTWIDHLHPDERESKLSAVQKYLKNPIEHFFLEFRFRHKDGSYIWVHNKASSVLDEKGEVVRMFGAHTDVTEKKKAEEHITLLAQIVNIAPGGIIVHDLEGQILYANQRSAQMHGCTNEEFRTLTLRDIDTPENAELIPTRMEDLIKNGEINFEGRHRRKDGSTYPVQVYAKKIEWTDKPAILSITTDITERKKAEEELERTKIQLIESIMQSPLPMVLTSAEDFKVKVINKATEDFLLINANDYLEKSLMEIDVVWQEYTPEGKKVEPFELPLPRALQGMVTHSKEMRLERRDGSSVWQLASGAPIFDSNGKLIAGLLVMQDITGRRSSEEALLQLSARLSLATKAGGVGVWDWNCVTDTLVWDDQMYNLYGMSRNTFGGAYESWQSGLHPEDLERCDREISEALAGQRDFNTEFRVIWPDSSVHYIRALAMIIRDQGGAAMRMIGTNWDITERKKAEEEIRTLNAELENRVKERTHQLETVNRELESFAYSVSHDLRAPLRAIDGFGLALLEDYRELFNGQPADYLERIRKNSQKMATLIDDLLNMSRVMRSELITNWVNISSIAKDTFNELTEFVKGRNIKLKLNEGMFDNADPKLIKLCLQNLLDNAIKFSSNRTDAEIELGFEMKGDKKVYHVRDNGIGFDMQYVGKLFGVFQRLHRDDEFPGTGIGLATTQKIIHRHGGEIWVESELNKGTTFYFTLK